MAIIHLLLSQKNVQVLTISAAKSKNMHDTSKINNQHLQQQREEYISQLGSKRVQELEDGFERVLDEYKPFYSMQYAYHFARAQTELRKIAERISEEKSKEEQLTSKERKQFERLKKRAEVRRERHKKTKRSKDKGKKKKTK